MKKATILSLVWMILTVAPMVSAQSPDVACLKDLCGSENPYGHPFEKAPQLKVEALKSVQQQVQKPLARYIGRIIHRGLLRDRLFQQLISQKTSFALRPEVAAFIQSMRYGKFTDEIQQALEQDSKGVFVFNQDKLKKALPKYSQAEIEAVTSLSPVLNFALTSNSTFQKPLEFVLKAYYPSLSLLESQKLEAQAVLATQNKLAALAPLSMAFVPRSVVVQRAAEGAVLSESEKNIFKGKIQQRIIYNAFLNPEVQEKFSKIPLDVARVIEEFRQTYPQSSLAQIFQNPKSIKSLYHQTLSTCSNQIAESYGALPTKIQKEEFRISVEKLRQVSANLVEERIQKPLTNEFVVELVLPSDREKFLPELASSLATVTATWDEQLRAIKKFNVQDPAVAEAIFIIASSQPADELLLEVTEFCDQAQQPSLTDAALSELKIINISWPTIVNPEVGLGIVAHELGHVASRNWKDSFIGEKSCLTSKQKSEHYLEEDFADLFATEVTRRLNFQLGKTRLGNFTCALQPRSNNGWTPGGQLANADAQDTHSSNFFRLMATASQTTGLKGSCVSHLKELKETRFESYCRWGQ